MKEKNNTKKTKFLKLEKIISFLTWLVGILVSLTVGAGMATGVLNLKVLFIPTIITVLTGWIIIISTLLSIVLKFFE